MKNPSHVRLVLASLLAFASHGCTHATGPESGPEPTVAAGTAPVAVAPAVRTPEPLVRVPVEGLPSIGNANALVTVVAFTDYTCPYCKRAEDSITKLRAAYGDDLRIVVAEKPLPMHERARPAALAALAADAQGKYEAMRARLYGVTGDIDEAAITDAARGAGLDLARFDADRSTASLATSEHLADRLGVTGTPTFVIDGRVVRGAQPYEVLRDVVNERLAAARALVATGARPADVYARLIANGAEHVAIDPDDDDAPGCGANCKDGLGAAPAVDKIETLAIGDSPARGAERASITIVAFGDFECPYSAKAEGNLRALEKAHAGDVRLVFKNLPLPFHTQARLAAKAALAADEQGHFWEFHDRLYARNGAPMDRPALEKIAGDLGLDVPRFDRTLDDPAMEARVAKDEAEAAALKVKGTPTFFVNGRRVVGAQPVSKFEEVIARSRTNGK